MAMTIGYVGNFSVPFTTENHLASTLEDLGHKVLRLQENERSSSQLIEYLNEHPIDLFMYTRTWGGFVMPETLDYLKKNDIKSVSYHLDLYVGLKRQDELDDPFWKTDYVFTPDGDPASQKVFQSKEINHFYIKPGVYKKECYMAPQIAFKHDVLFVGNGDYPHKEWPYRQELLEFLKGTYGERYGKYGNPQPTIRGKELNQLYGHSKVTVGDSLCIGFKKPYYWSDRVYETLGRGGFLIHPYIEGLEEEFLDGVHLAFYEYGNFKELKSKIDYFIKSDKVREDIRNIGHNFVKEFATYNNRLKQMLEIIK